MRAERTTARRRARFTAGVLAGCAAVVAAAAAPAGAQTFVRPPGTPNPAPACGAIGVGNPPATRGYPIPTLNYIVNGTLTNGPTTVSNITATLCSVFQVPEYPNIVLPSSLFPALPAVNPGVPQSAAVFSTSEVTYGTAKLKLGKLPAGTVTFTPVAISSLPPPQNHDGCTNEPADTSVCAPVEQNTAPGGGFNLDIVTAVRNTINLSPGAVLGVSLGASCNLQPSIVPFTTSQKEFPPGSTGYRDAKSITGPLDDASATVVSTPKFAHLPPITSCRPNLPAPVLMLLSAEIDSGTPTFTAPLSLNLSLTHPPTTP